MSSAAVEFVGVRKAYGASVALDNFSFSIPGGQIVTIIGPSGCGKTTTLKMINRLIEPDAGKVLVDGEDISRANPVELRRSIGYVIQQIGLFPHMTIEQNIAIVPRLNGKKRKETIGRTKELLAMIGLDAESFGQRYPHELSGGQQQRIGVARALAAEPSIVLMDEPFSALDPISRVQLQNELMKLNQQMKKTIVFVTHDIDEAVKIADQIVLLKDGHLVQAASPSQMLLHPANDFVREFVLKNRVQSAQAMMTARDIMEQIESWKRDGTDESFRADAPAVKEHTPAAEVFALLKTNRIVPVVDAADQLQGFITRSSIIDAMARFYEQEGMTG